VTEETYGGEETNNLEIDPHLKKIAYILLWFPKPSETFIFREVVNLWKLKVPITIYTLYGELKASLSPEMQEVSPRVERLGIPWLKTGTRDLIYWWRRKPDITATLLRTIPLRRWRSLEVGGENIWAFFCGFSLARRFEEEEIEHIHAPWANGPATAAWVASKLTGIPFSFMGRAVDIYPPDGALSEKIHHSAFVRTNPKVNVEYLASLSENSRDKIYLGYDACPLEDVHEAPVAMVAPYHIVALGRFARIKGFEFLLRAAKIMDRAGLDFHLTLAGNGPKNLELRFLRRILKLSHRISFPGYVRYNMVSELLCSADVFVMPSIIHRTGERDGIPNVIVEALMHRVPVVATDVAGIGEVIKNGVTGYLVPQRNQKALADAIIRMTSDRKASLQMAEQGRKLVMEQFDGQRCTRELFDLFKRLC